MNIDKQPAVSVRVVFERARDRLADAGIDDPQVDAELLIGAILETSRGGVQAAIVTDRALDAVQQEHLEPLVARRCTREPLQHILGVAAFRSLELDVGEGVFVPRPETELVAQLAIDALRADASAEPLAIDLGTGSGAIALSLAVEVPHSRVIAVERSDQAIAWTRRNVRKNHVTNVEVLHGDLANTPSGIDGTAAVVVSNPPYVPSGEVPRDAEVREWDPEEALYGGEDGLDVVRVLDIVAARLLRPGGVLVIEHAEFQSAAIRQILTRGGWTMINHHVDLTGRDRATTATKTSLRSSGATGSTIDPT